MSKAAVYTHLGDSLSPSSSSSPAARHAGPPGALLAVFALLAAVSGALIAFVDLNALYLLLALIGCAFILFDFRIGVVLLILLLPISRSALFPHAMFGITGLNPLNLLMIATLGSCLLRALGEGALGRFLPRPLLWLYIVPLVIAGLLGMRHVGEIAPHFTLDEVPLDFSDAAGYLREFVFKPLMLVVFALLVAAAIERSEKGERFLAPAILSIWVMGGLVIGFVALSGLSLRDLASAAGRGLMTDLGMHANELGRLYAVAYALLLFTWAQARHPGLRFALLASIALIVAALLLTFSRSAFAGFIIVTALFLLWQLNARTLVFAALVAAIAFFALPAVVHDRAMLGFGEGLDAISAGRLEGIWKPLFPAFVAAPLFGSGHGSILWSEAMRMGGGEAMLSTTHPHNAYLQALLDMGIVGLVLVCAYFYHVWKGFRALAADASLSPTLRGFYQGAAAGLAAFLIVGVVDSSLMPKAEQAFLWLAIGMMYGHLALRRQAG